jgi:hypothetical protein
MAVDSAPTSQSRGEPSSAGLADQLTQLAHLHSSGALTDQEFALAKARLLGG